MEFCSYTLLEIIVSERKSTNDPFDNLYRKETSESRDECVPAWKLSFPFGVKHRESVEGTVVCRSSIPR